MSLLALLLALALRARPDAPVPPARAALARSAISTGPSRRAGRERSRGLARRRRVGAARCCPCCPWRPWTRALGSHLLGLPQLAFAVLVLLVSFGPRDLRDEVDDYVAALERGDRDEGRPPRQGTARRRRRESRRRPARRGGGSDLRAGQQPHLRRDLLVHGARSRRRLAVPGQRPAAAPRAPSRRRGAACAICGDRGRVRWRCVHGLLRLDSRRGSRP
ncbi:MAG: hypothetical protein MZV65_17595 [Chromatiales bacterium]|nr:hypothetical protein [Chromatiales bacterium]